MARNKEFNPSERLEKARNLFWKNGYHATSMESLVKGMRINRGSMYATYGDKHQLFLDSLYDYAEATFKAYMSAISADESPLNSVKNIVYKAIERTFEEKKACMLVKSSFELAPHDSELKDILHTLNDKLVAIFERLLQEAQAKNEIGIEKNPTLLAQFIVSSFAGFWQMQTLYNDKEQVKRLASTLFSILS